MGIRRTCAAANPEEPYAEMRNQVCVHQIDIAVSVETAGIGIAGRESYDRPILEPGGQHRWCDRKGVS